MGAVNPFAVTGDDFIPMDVAQLGKRAIRRYQNQYVQLDSLNYWRHIFYTAASSRFTWSGLPKGVDSRYLETHLFRTGVMGVTRMDGVNRWLCATPTQEGQLDVQNNPNRVRLLADNGYSCDRHCNMWIDEGVMKNPDAWLVWDNEQRLPLQPMIDIECRRLATLDNIIMQHANAQRVPYVVVVPEEAKGAAEELYNRVANGEPAIYVTPAMADVVGLNVAQTFGTNSYIIDKLLNDQLKIVSRVYTLLGIDNNAAAEKKERVQTSETLSNNEQFMIQRKAALAPRAAFAEAFNDATGYNVSVTFAVHHIGEDVRDDTIEGGEEFDF